MFTFFNLVIFNQIFIVLLKNKKFINSTLDSRSLKFFLDSFTKKLSSVLLLYTDFIA